MAMDSRSVPANAIVCHPNDPTNYPHPLGELPPEPVPIVLPKRPRGRPRGSRNKKSATAAAPDQSLAVLAPGPLPLVVLPKRPRGRPPGSKNKKPAAAAAPVGLPPALGDFTPRVCHIKTGQDIVSTIQGFTNHGTHRVFIISANGAVTGVSLRHGDTIVAHYKGSYEIVRLSADSPSEGGSGALTLTISAGDGSVYVGEVSGVLRAASPPVQLVLGICAIAQPAPLPLAASTD